MLSLWFALGVISVASGLHAVDGSAPQAILDRMAAAYCSARSYRDAGSARTTFIRDQAPRRVKELRFKTAFVRPNRFRFEYRDSTDSQSRYIIWASGSDIRIWWGIRPGVEGAPSIGYALGGAAGVSDGTSMTVPTLLLPSEVLGADAGGARRVEYNNPVRLADDTLNGNLCFRLQAQRYSEPSEPSTLWIDKVTYLIRRIDSSHKFRDFRTEDTTVYEPFLNIDVDKAALTFDAPEGGPTTR